jgi:IS30 family transposase
MKQNNKLKVTNEAIIREDRRRKVMQYVQQSMSETEIAQRLGVSKPTITRDIQHLREVANQFITSLAKDSLALWYKDLLDDTNKARLKAWSIYDNSKDEQRQLHALKIIITSNESIFNLLQAGPMVMSVKGIQDQLTMLLERGNYQQQI